MKSLKPMTAILTVVLILTACPAPEPPAPVTLIELQEMIANGEDVTQINTSEITDMIELFYGYSDFNQDISEWDVSSVTNMSYMFNSASAFNQDISSWEVSSVTDMRYVS